MHVYLIPLHMPCVLLYWLCKVYAVYAGVSTVFLAPGTTWRVCVPDAEGPARLPLFREVHRPVSPAAAAWRRAQHQFSNLLLLSDHMFWNHLTSYCLRFDRCSDPLFLYVAVWTSTAPPVVGLQLQNRRPCIEPMQTWGTLEPFSHATGLATSNQLQVWCLRCLQSKCYHGVLFLLFWSSIWYKCCSDLL